MQLKGILGLTNKNENGLFDEVKTNIHNIVKNITIYNHIVSSFCYNYVFTH